MNQTLKLYKAAINYHRYPYPGKLSIVSKKTIESYHDLALAYSPGVSAACQSIQNNEKEASNLTSRSNLVAIISNGSAVLGLGCIGPLASKPVMEGKAILLKKLADVDAFDLEINESNSERLVNIIASLEPTFGAINLEDIKAPECFDIERELSKRLQIPVFHDDQHGTAVVVSAAIVNALRIVNKSMREIKLVVAGAGAAALASLNLLIDMGLNRKKVFVVDSFGLIYQGRQANMNPAKAPFQQRTEMRTLEEAIDKADIFLGLSSGGVLKPETLTRMSDNPIILALSNPTPEVDPIQAKEVRPDAIIATGRSDFPNQVNNLLCFPFILRGALDVGASQINKEMKLACVQAIVKLAGDEKSQTYSRNNIVPDLLDPRLAIEVPLAVARAALRTGVARNPIKSLRSYRQSLVRRIPRSKLILQPLFIRIRKNQFRIVYPEGENEQVLKAVQAVVDERIARPILVGRPKRVEESLEKLGLQISSGKDFELIDPKMDSCFNGVYLMDLSFDRFRRQLMKFTSSVVRQGYADGMLCCLSQDPRFDLSFIKKTMKVFKSKVRKETDAALLITDQGGEFFFMSSPYGNMKLEHTPTAWSNMALQSICQVKKFGITPRVTFSLVSTLGSDREPYRLSRKDLRKCLLESIDLVKRYNPELEVRFDQAFTVGKERQFKRQSSVNLVVIPMVRLVDVVFWLSHVLENTSVIGCVFPGLQKPLGVFTPQTTISNIVNLTAMACTQLLLPDEE